MIYISNNCFGDNVRRTFGKVEIRISNDGSDWSLDPSAFVISDIYDGGFFRVMLSDPARYIAVRRIGTSPKGNNKFVLTEVRVFENTNLLMSIGSSILTATPWDG